MNEHVVRLRDFKSRIQQLEEQEKSMIEKLQVSKNEH